MDSELDSELNLNASKMPPSRRYIALVLLLSDLNTLRTVITDTCTPVKISTEIVIYYGRQSP
jgi:hypothetical protein